MTPFRFFTQRLVLRVKIFFSIAHAYFIEHSPLRTRVGSYFFETAPLHPILSNLLARGTILNYGLQVHKSTDPPFLEWAALYRDTESGGGLSFSSHYDALAAATAEATERSIWFSEVDFFSSPRLSTTTNIKDTAYLSPFLWQNYTPSQQQKHPELTISPASTFLWIKGKSWTDDAPVYIPAQIVSRIHASQHIKKDEPRLSPTITTGLATGQTRINALLGGVLEVIERDAFMITWLNELTLPEIQLTSLTSLDEELARLVEECATQGLTVSFCHLLTDAPVHVISAFVLDSQQNPPFAVGASAQASGVRAAKKALLEALRGRKNARNRMTRMKQEAQKHIFNFRTEYWYDSEKLPQAVFLAGKGEIPFTPAAWEKDSAQEHFNRIVTWCREKKYTFASVDMTLSRKNATPWYIYFSLIPQLQPLFHDEKLPCLQNSRLHEVPTLFGYTPRQTPFTEPHPFL